MKKIWGYEDLTLLLENTNSICISTKTILERGDTAIKIFLHPFNSKYRPNSIPENIMLPIPKP